jgi:hypothetical protein
MQERITEGEYYQLLGLLTLARGHVSAVDAIERSMLAITGEDGAIGAGHTGDTIYGRTGDVRAEVDDLLRRLDIIVKADPTRET